MAIKHCTGLWVEHWNTQLHLCLPTSAELNKESLLPCNRPDTQGNNEWRWVNRKWFWYHCIKTFGYRFFCHGEKRNGKVYPENVFQIDFSNTKIDCVQFWLKEHRNNRQQIISSFNSPSCPALAPAFPQIIFIIIYSSIVDIRYISFRCTMQWFDNAIHCTMLPTMRYGHFMALLQYYWLYSLRCTLYPCNLFIL